PAARRAGPPRGRGGYPCCGASKPEVVTLRKTRLLLAVGRPQGDGFVTRRTDRRSNSALYRGGPAFRARKAHFRQVSAAALQRGREVTPVPGTAGTILRRARVIGQPLGKVPLSANRPATCQDEPHKVYQPRRCEEWRAAPRSNARACCATPAG